MTVETATKVEDLNAAYPTGSDQKSEGDDHIRLVKSVLLYTFAGAASTGVVGFNVYTQPPGTANTLAASTSFVVSAIAAAALSGSIPAGTNGQTLSVLSGAAAWTSVVNTLFTTVSGTTQTAVAGNAYLLTNVAATTVTLPASPAANDKVVVKVANGLLTNVINPNGNTIEGISGNLTIDSTSAIVTLQYLNSSWRLV
jgi:hypothetical protein